MDIKKWVRERMQSFLEIKPAQVPSISVNEILTFEGAAFEHRIWYRGDAHELNQLYKQLDNCNRSFWGCVPTDGMEIRKIHTGLPKIIVHTLANIALRDRNDFEFKEQVNADLWSKIAKENNFNKLLERALKQVLSVGDGAFKYSFDINLSEFPIIEFYPSDRVNLVQDRGRVKEVVFETRYNYKDKEYHLCEHYGVGTITYNLYLNGKEVALESIPQTKDLVSVNFAEKCILAVPFMVFESDKWAGRGQSIFDGKCDNFDAFDEVWSQWIDSLRSARPKTYIPEKLLPKDPETGEIINPNPFDNRFIRIENDMSEGATGKIDIAQPQIPADGLLQTYVTALDLCLQGLISPSTLGIDTKKLDNAEAQREKEKTTLYTRNSIIAALCDVLPRVVETALCFSAILHGEPIPEINVAVGFGEYASPSFEAVVETLSNPNTPMSVEAKVEEMWGDSKTQEWKAEEVGRIKEQTGIVMLDEPSMGQDAQMGF